MSIPVRAIIDLIFQNPIRRWSIIGLGLFLITRPNSAVASQWTGAMIVEHSTVDGWVQVRENTQEGTRLSLRNDLGIQWADSYRLSLAYQFSEERRLIFNLGTTLLRGEKTLSDLTFFNWSSFPAGTDLRSNPVFYQAKMTYQQTLYQPRRGSLNLLAGLEYDYLNFLVRGTTPSGEVKNEGEDFWKQELPIPFVGLEARYAASERWSFRASSTYGAWNNVNSLRKEGGTVRLTQKNFITELATSYQASERWSFEVGYRFLSFMQDEQSNEDGNRIHLGTHGPTVQAAYRF